MTADERKARRDARAAQTAVCDECKLTGAHAEGCSKRPPAPRNLDDPATQEAILEPVPEPLTIGGEEAKLFALPSKLARKFVAVVTRVINATATRGEMGAMSVRLTNAIEGDDDLCREFYWYVARSEHRSGEVVENDALIARAAWFDENASFVEAAAAFDRLCTLNHIDEVFGRPKSPSTSGMPTS